MILYLAKSSGVTDSTPNKFLKIIALVADTPRPPTRRADDAGQHEEVEARCGIGCANWPEVAVTDVLPWFDLDKKPLNKDGNHVVTLPIRDVLSRSWITMENTFATD
ncbi:hypothetical protein BV898_18797 [Hypsibius exemplaris]|uniref:Uncharacterized protein n=1 Tax=Hypsibius exemplaris TaxID=2072580 RepID=A0A9X6RNI1_HYPEX|nr:hypothetical protein BV898_18797 [Hypsibius exemplaris]